jgi:predicted RNA-binding Zn-ribbon protein involved in translation (DUF1610 family)
MTGQSLSDFVKNNAHFRHMARDYLTSAKRHFETEDSSNLYYCALDLRRCLEALTYEVSKGYVDDLNGHDISIWQPSKLMAALLEIDPMADKTKSMEIADEAPAGDQVWHNFGTEHRISNKDLKRHYDALGSYLHVPTMGQLQKKGSHDLDKLKSRCESLLDLIEKVLSSAMWNLHVRPNVKFACDKCGGQISRRVNKLALYSKSGESGIVIDVDCFSCEASYQIERGSENKFAVKPKTIEVKCLYSDCGGHFFPWQRAIQPGSILVCPHCNRDIDIVLGMKI